jgi:hypothetical protein
MKKGFQLFVALELIGFCSSLSLQAGEAKPQSNKESTVWVAPPVGSLIGGGYAGSGQTRIWAKTIEHEKPALRNAIEMLDSQGGLVVRGVGLVPAAVAWQTKVPVRQLVQQQADTRLSYGELLIANSLAQGSEKSFNEILALRRKSKSWGELSLKLHINPDSIVARAAAASDSIRYAEARSNRRRQQNLQDSGYDLRHSQNSSVAPHSFVNSREPGG